MIFMDFFLSNLSLMLAHTILYETKKELSPNGIVDDAVANLSPGNPPNPGIASSIATRSTVRNLPRILDILNDYAPQMAQGQYNASEQVSPQYAALDLFLREQFGIPTSDANAAIADRNASNLAGIFSGGGADLIRSASEGARIADPEFYAGRERVDRGTQALLEGQDPNRLTEAEMENATRGVNRTNIGGGNVNPSATTTTSNALMFGDELAKKRGRFSEALGLAAGSLPNLRSGADTFRQVTGQPGTASLGGTQFTGVTPVGESQTANSQASGVLGSAQQNWTNLANNMDLRTTADRFSAGQVDY